MNLFALSATEARRLVNQNDLPLFAYKVSVARERWLRLRQLLPERVRLAYAVKANPGLPLLQCFAGLDSSFDCASAGELERLVQLGVSGQRILFAGPGKSDRDIAAAMQAGARLQVDSLEDMARIHHLVGTQDGDPVEVNLRVNPLHLLQEHRSIIGGTGPSAFGVDEEVLPEFLEQARRYTNVRLAGLHMFTASNELDHRKLLNRHETAFKVARKLQETHGINLNCLDLGGGLGIPYAASESELLVSDFAAGLEALLSANTWFSGELVLEPGRWLAATCGVYLTRVIRIKHSRGQRFVIVQEGINHLLRPLLTGQPFPVQALDVPHEALPVHESVLAGPLCTALDRLGTVLLPELDSGSVLMFGQVGAYGRTEAMNDFLCREAPRELWLD